MKKLLLSCVAVLLVPLTASAVPLQIPYSGQLSENGSLVTGARDLTVSVYPTPAGGTLLYSESFPGTVVQNGVYHVMLNVPPTVWDGSDRWLAVSVNGGPPLEPRVQISTVPYAVRSATADIAEALSNLPVQPGVNFKTYRNDLPDILVASTAWMVIDSVSINCPADGFLLMSAVGSITGGLPFCARIGIGEQQPSIQRLVLAYSAPGGVIYPISITEVVPVTSGIHMIRVWAQKCESSPNNAVYVPHSVQALWFPNRYQ